NPLVAPLKQAWTQEPPQQGEKTARVTFDADPMAMMAWHMPNFPNPDSVALDVLSTILTSGNTSRLMKSLVFGKKIVTGVSSSTGFPGDRSPTLFVMEFNPAPKQTSEGVVASIDQELLEIQKKGITPQELER